MKNPIKHMGAYTTLAAVALSLAGLSSPVAADDTTATDALPDRPMLLMPIMDAARGRELFASKGCVVCHSVNEIGGVDAPSFNDFGADGPMDPFDFAARMWRGAPAMIMMQENELGGQIELTGAELSDIIAFVHSAGEKAKFSEADIPENILEILSEDDDGEGDGDHS